MFSTLSKMANFRLFQTERVCGNNFKFVENGRKLSKQVENSVEKKEKLLVTRNFSFSQCLRLVLQTRKNKSLCGKELNI